jgi:hypothetical protein
MDSSPVASPPDPPAHPQRRLPAGAVGALVLFVVVALGLLRFASVRTESINWDEFNLMQNAAWTLSSGELHAGGRPGLAVLILLPFVSDCQDEIAAIQQARGLWLFFTFAALAGLATLLTRIRPRSPQRFTDAALGLALLAAVPSFLIWSLQIRTDQIALACGLWGAVALLASRERPPLAGLAGILFGLGYLSSQKVVYVAGLAGVLALGDLWRLRERELTREALRAVTCIAAMGMMIVGFHASIPILLPGEAASQAPAVSNLGFGAAGAAYDFQMSVFDYYRKTIGYSQYVAILPTLIPHVCLLALMAAATLIRFWRRQEIPRRLVLAWAVVLLGLLVGLFHAGAFAYFWMTLGLFPAVAIVLARDAIAELFAPWPRLAQQVAVAGLVVLLLAPAAVTLTGLLEDTQSVQRESLRFTQRNFDRSDTGFHPEAGLFCRDDPHHFPAYFSQLINRIFGPEARCMTCAPEFIGEFYEKQVKFIVASFRLGQFPQLVRSFVEQNYLPYVGSVMVAGKRFEEEGESTRDFSLVVDGDYLWLPNRPPALIEIDGVRIPTGGRVQLKRGSHVASFPEGQTPGVLVLAMGEPPKLPMQRFYRTY